MKINEILTLSLADDIKHVIDLENQSENAVQEEIDTYIVTENIGNYFSKFINQYKSNPKETGVWLSGFYGSGKSHFGKILGLLLSNRDIAGMPVFERLINRIDGLKNKNLLESDLRSISGIKTKVIFFDLAKQTGTGSTQNIFWTVFKNFMLSLNFAKDNYGMIEYNLYLEDKLDEFHEFFKNKKENWYELRKDSSKKIKGFKEYFTQIRGFSDPDFAHFLDMTKITNINFDSNQLKTEIDRYITKFKDVKIVFIMDEASEAIALKRIKAIDLEALSETFSSMNSKVWTIAIAQSKLDDIYEAADIDVQQLTKIKDRFRLSIHLESTEVDYIIKQRLLLKNDSTKSAFEEFYKNNLGMINDFTNLNGKFSTKVNDLNDFISYYPFHKYQFRLLENVLFKSKSIGKSHTAERGLLKTTFDVLKMRVRDKELFKFVTINDISKHSIINLPHEVRIKAERTERLFNEEKIDLKAEALFRVIHFLDAAEEVLANIENITRGYIDDPNDYYTYLDNIKTSLNLLIEKNLLLEIKGVYKIPSDKEQELLDEMAENPVQKFVKDKYYFDFIKNNDFIKPFENISHNSIPFKFSLMSEKNQELNNNANKNLVVSFISIYSFDDSLIDRLKRSSDSPNTIKFVADNSNFRTIDYLIQEINKLKNIIEKYSSESDEKVRSVVSDFRIKLTEKETELRKQLNDAFSNGIIVLRGDTFTLTEKSYNQKINESLKKALLYVYDKIPSTQLDERIAEKIIKEMKPTNLASYFSSDEYKFFDGAGNFIGENLPIISELKRALQHYESGDKLEKELNEPPKLYLYGTISTSLAALLKAGKIFIKYNGEEFFNIDNIHAKTVFSNSREFKKATFKFLSINLDLNSKRQIVDNLKELKVSNYIDVDLDYSTNNIELVNIIKLLADKLKDKIIALTSNEESRKFFGYLRDYTELLSNYLTKVTDQNYINNANSFITDFDEFKSIQKKIIKVEEFIKKDFGEAKNKREFSKNIIEELNKFGSKYSENDAYNLAEEIERLINSEIIVNFQRIKELTLRVKDNYFILLNDKHSLMFSAYSEVKEIALNLKKDISELDIADNLKILKDVNEIISYSDKHRCSKLQHGFETNCENCLLSLYEIDQAVQLKDIKLQAVDELRSNVVWQMPAPLPVVTSASPLPPAIPVKVQRKVNNPLKKTDYNKNELKATLESTLIEISYFDDDDLIQIIG